MWSHICLKCLTPAVSQCFRQTLKLNLCCITMTSSVLLSYTQPQLLVHLRWRGGAPLKWSFGKTGTRPTVTKLQLLYSPSRSDEPLPAWHVTGATPVWVQQLTALAASNFNIWQATLEKAFPSSHHLCSEAACERGCITQEQILAVW